MAAPRLTTDKGSAIITMFDKYVADILDKAKNHAGFWSWLYTNPSVAVQDMQNTKILYLTDNLDRAVNDATDNYAAQSQWLGEARNVDNFLRNTAGYNYKPEWGNLDTVLGAHADVGMDVLDVANNGVKEVTGEVFAVAEKTAAWTGKTLGGFLDGVVQGIGPGGMFLLTVAAVVVVGVIVIKKS